MYHPFTLCTLNFYLYLLAHANTILILDSPERYLTMNYAGLSSAPAEDSLMERSKEKKERRLSAPLPTPPAATNQGARLTANNIISNVLHQLAP
jgi:hypothetical protein